MPDRTRGRAGFSAGVCSDMAVIVPAGVRRTGTASGRPGRVDRSRTMSGMPGTHSTVPTLTDGVVVLRAPSDDDIERFRRAVPGPVDASSGRRSRSPTPATTRAATCGTTSPTAGRPTGSGASWWRPRTTTATRRFCGTISLRNEGHGRAEIAYGSHPWVRGRGVMERALRLLLEWGFAERDLQTVIWLARRGNWPRAGWPGGWASASTGRCAPGSPARRVSSTRGRAPCVAVSRWHRGRTWLRAPRIVGDSVVLRGAAEADLPRLVDGGNDPQVQRYSQSLRAHAPHDEAKARERELELLEESASGESLTWTVADAATDELLGWLALFRIDRGEAEVGYWAHPAARGRGAMVEACRMAVRHAFIDTEDGGLGLHRLTAYAAVDNRRLPPHPRAGRLHPGRRRAQQHPAPRRQLHRHRSPSTSWP